MTRRLRRTLLRRVRRTPGRALYSRFWLHLAQASCRHRFSFSGFLLLFLWLADPWLSEQRTWHLCHVRPLLTRVTLSTRSSRPFSFVFCQVSRRPAAANAFVDLGGCVRLCSRGASAHFPPPHRVVLGPGLDLHTSLDDSFFRRSPPFRRFSVIRTARDDTFVLAAICRRFLLSAFFFASVASRLLLSVLSSLGADVGGWAPYFLR